MSVLGRARRAVPPPLWWALVLALSYAACYELVVAVTSFGTSVGSTFWPGAGVTFTILARRPRREWLPLVGVVVVVEALLDVRHGFGLGVGLAWGFANGLEPLLGVALLRRGDRGAPDPLARRDLERFVACAVLAGPAVGALVGTAGAWALAGDPWWPRLGRWYIGDAIGVLAIAPALLLVGGQPLARPRGADLPGVLVLAGVSVLALGPWSVGADAGLPFLVLPALAFVAVRLGGPGAAIAVLALAMLVEVVTAAGEGPFAADDALDGLLVAQMFVAMGATTALLLAALTRDLVTRDHMALHDSLTGLANRRLLFDRLDQASRRLHRHGGLVALVFLDLDGFKRINDERGHGTGDAVLAEVGRRLEAAVRDTDTVARIGGDEFVVLAQDLTDAQEVEVLADRLLAALEQPITVRSQHLVVGASLGIATTEEELDDTAAFLARADRAMYAAKQSGGSRVVRGGRGAGRELAAQRRS